MSNYVVTALDTTGIQSYIFNSNRLRENIGASYLVDRATGDWVRDELEALGAPRNQQETSIKNSGLKGELIYVGGGNALLLFKSVDIAKQFTQKLSRKLLKQAPGVNLVAAHIEFNWDDDGSLKEKVELLQEELEKQKRSRRTSVPLLGLGVTATCQSTQLPAVNTSEEYIKFNKEDREEDIYFISRETEEKLRVVSSKHGETTNEANKAIRSKFQEVLKNTPYQFPYRMDHLGRTRDDNSYYAIVHADGNSMGERFTKYVENSSENRDYIYRIRNLSKSVDRAGFKSIERVIQILINSIDSEGKVMGQFSIFTQDGKPYLPFRPLVYGGDDITFVCDGRLGLELAAIFLKTLQKPNLYLADGQPMTACAGVCIVKSHYPFARAYALSEALCRNAKSFVRDEKQNIGNTNSFSAMDWHIASSGLLGSIGEIRQREYQVNEGDLTMRPIFIEDEVDRWRTWTNFTDAVECFKGNLKDCQTWKNRRNKIIALREKLREGRKATNEFRKAYSIGDLPLLKGGYDLDDLQTNGWTEDRCGYFDAIEAMEFYFPLKQGDSDDCLHIANEVVE
ncbi:Cas10/Cmr2 second palm domain-containing protein [Baaleninema simplex]|uniref:Cas10/Cmr2 second palm domain-containing protein n=1 Tax=Baaleninema simplex TaxID=2862350 RepID=UPI00034CFA60|nr:hypothetical protein [Baaleninema simplex]